MAHEAEVVLAQATEFAKDQSVAILARTWGLVETAARGLSFRTLDPEMHV
ncbi:MAG: hypothetical protein ACXVXW_11220 [Mycobacteriaceae bacterium]